MRRQRVSRFVVVLVLIFPLKIFSQQLSPRIAQISPQPQQFSCSPQLKMSPGFFNNLVGPDKFLRPQTQAWSLLQVPTEQVRAVAAQQFSYCGSYISHLGFFCQKEYQFERSTSVPLRLRLGSLAYVDKMEGKK
jgi:hypothetical protein